MSFARKTTQLTLRMDPEVKHAAEKAAADDRRSLSALIEILLIIHCKDRGFLTADGRLPGAVLELKEQPPRRRR